jgi:hypothetical protein
VGARFWEFALYRKTKVQLPTLDTMPQFLKYLELKQGGSNNMSDWVSGQHRSALPDTVKSDRKEFSRLCERLACDFRDAADRAAHDTNCDTDPLGLFLKTMAVGHAGATRNGAREGAVLTLYDAVDRHLQPDTNRNRLIWLMSTVLADVEEVFLFPFGKPRHCFFGHGGREGATRLADLSKDDLELLFSAEEDDVKVSRKDRKSRPGKEAKLQELARFFLYKMRQCKDDKILLVLFGWRVVDGEVRLMTNDRPICLTDAEHALCKVYVCHNKTCGAFRCSKTRKPFSNYCWPQLGLENEQAFDQVKEVFITRIKQWASLEDKSKYEVPAYFRDEREFRD